MNASKKIICVAVVSSVNLVGACSQMAATSSDRKTGATAVADPTAVQPAATPAPAASTAVPGVASKQPAISLTANTPGACIAAELASPANAPGAAGSVFTADAASHALSVDSAKLSALLAKCGISKVSPSNLALISKNFIDAVATPTVGSTLVTSGSTVINAPANGGSTVTPGGNVTVNITNSVAPQAMPDPTSSGSSSVTTSQSSYGHSLSLGYASYSLFNILGRIVGGVVALPFAAVGGAVTGVAQGLSDGLNYGPVLVNGPTVVTTTTTATP